MVNVVLVVPIVPGQMPIEHLHVFTAANHERMCAVYVVGHVNMFADSLRRMFSCIEMLSAQIHQSPVAWQFISNHAKLLCESIDEPGIVFKDNVRIDVLN